MREIIRWLLILGSLVVVGFILWEVLDREHFDWEDEGIFLLFVTPYLLNAVFLYTTREAFYSPRDALRDAFANSTLGLWLKLRRARYQREIEELERR